MTRERDPVNRVSRFVMSGDTNTATTEKVLDRQHTRL